MKNDKVRRIVTLGLLAAVAVVLVALVHFPIIPGVTFLEYDAGDIAIFLGAFLFGPVPGLMLTTVASLIQGLTVSAQSGWIGIVMHILATGSYVIMAGFIYKKWHTRKGAVAALAVGTVCMTAVMCVCNLIFTPLFLGRQLQDVVAMLVPVIIPFNLAKAGINSLVTFLVYKPLSRLVFKERPHGAFSAVRA